MFYARINLSKTNYTILENFKLLTDPPVDELKDIYKTYCEYKKFKSVMPIFTEEFTDKNSDVLGYYHKNKLVAFSLIKKYKLDKSVDAVQFAWDYKDPELELGYASLRSECAMYKNLGYDYLYLGGADEYKSKFDGFEILGKL